MAVAILAISEPLWRPNWTEMNAAVVVVGAVAAAPCDSATSRHLELESARGEIMR